MQILKERLKEILKILSGLPRDLTVSMKEDKIIQLVAKKIKLLFPHQMFAIQILSPTHKEFVIKAKQGRLKRLSNSPLEITKEALRECSMIDKLIKDNLLKVKDSYSPIFVGSRGGFEIPLCTKNEFYGLLKIEYKEDKNIDIDKEILIFIADYLSRVISDSRTMQTSLELQVQLIQAEKLATIGQLAAGVIHELNNPLTSISVYSKYLLEKFKKQAMDEKDTQRLEIISKSASRILKLCKDLITYARPSFERPKLINLNEILDEAISFSEHIIQASKAKIIKQYDKDLPFISGIKDRLLQMFLNLIQNACEALSNQGGDIILLTERFSRNQIRVCIQDTGCGIPSEHLSQIFKPFFTTKEPTKGTGLGLSIVKYIADLHNASLKVKSKKGEKTEFSIIFETAG